MADHGFIGTYAPGFLSMPGQPPLDDEYWDPVWALYAELDLTVVVHAGWGMDQGYAFGEIAKACQVVDAKNGTDMDLIMELVSGLFSSQFFADLGHRRALWQLMLGGVFDRHPELRVMFTEVRADWIPATLALLDQAFEAHRADLPTTRRPSDTWRSNCLAGVSFLHKVEIERRAEIGVDRMSFGRDYPHAEGTWPNTSDYLRDLFAGVSETDTRKILGENLVGFLGLDAARDRRDRRTGRADPRRGHRRQGSRRRPALAPRRPLRLRQALRGRHPGPRARVDARRQTCPGSPAPAEATRAVAHPGSRRRAPLDGTPTRAPPAPTSGGSHGEQRPERTRSCASCSTSRPSPR